MENLHMSVAAAKRDVEVLEEMLIWLNFLDQCNMLDSKMTKAYDNLAALYHHEMEEIYMQMPYAQID